MVSHSHPVLRWLGAAGIAAALFIAPASATEGTVGTEPAASNAAVEVPLSAADVAQLPATVSEQVSRPAATDDAQASSRPIASAAHPAAKRHRIAARRYHRVASNGYFYNYNEDRCAGWCGRHLVLMIGIGY